MNPPISRQILTEADLAHYLDSAQAIGSLGYRGLTICLYSHPAQRHTRLVNIEGLGHSLWMLYIYATETDLIVAVDTFFEDFTDFVLFEREENHASIH